MPVAIEGKEILAYKTTREIWGKSHTCVAYISELLRDGQIRGILQHLEKKYKALDEFQRILKEKKKFTVAEIEERINSIIEGQFIPDILKFEILSSREFLYYCNFVAFAHLKDSTPFQSDLTTSKIR